LTTAARNGRATDERWQLKKDGSRLFASGMVTPVIDDANMQIGFTKVSREITVQTELDNSLRDRARELAAADQRKNEFLAMLAHELRNPLTSIHYAVDLVKMAGAENFLPDVLGIIAEQTPHLTRLIDDLLDISRITLGKVDLKLDSVEVASIIHRAARAVRPLIEQRKHELIVPLTASSSFVRADPTRLEQI
jgi:signal transduction histidine kinase